MSLSRCCNLRPSGRRQLHALLARRHPTQPSRFITHRSLHRPLYLTATSTACQAGDSRSYARMHAHARARGAHTHARTADAAAGRCVAWERAAHRCLLVDFFEQTAHVRMCMHAGRMYGAGVLHPGGMRAAVEYNSSSVYVIATGIDQWPPLLAAKA